VLKDLESDEDDGTDGGTSAMEYKVASVAQRYDHLCYEKEYDSYRTTEYRRSLEVERALVLYTRINSRI
jgi:hypothetical protein